MHAYRNTHCKQSRCFGSRACCENHALGKTRSVFISLYYEHVSGLQQLRVWSPTWGLPLWRVGVFICLDLFPDAQIRTTHKVSSVPICQPLMILGEELQRYGSARM